MPGNDRLDVLLSVRDAMNEKMAEKIDRELDAQDQAMEELDLLRLALCGGLRARPARLPPTSEAGPSEEADSPWSTGSINHPIRLSPKGHLARVLFCDDASDQAACVRPKRYPDVRQAEHKHPYASVYEQFVNVCLFVYAVGAHR